MVLLAIYIINGVQAHCIISEKVNISDMILIQRLNNNDTHIKTAGSHLWWQGFLSTLFHSPWQKMLDNEQS